MKKIVILLMIFLLFCAAGSYIVINQVVSKKTERLVALGDSLTYGVGEESGKGYTDNLQRLFDKHVSHPVTVNNYGVPGQQSDGLLYQVNHVKEVSSNISKADYIIVFIGTNDVIKSNGGDLYPLYKDRIQQGKEDYKKNITLILKKVRKQNPDAPVLFLGLYNPYPSSEKLEKVIKDWNSSSKEILKPYSHVTFIPTEGLFKEKSRKYFSDALHPNKQGYDLITKRIIKEYNF
ncbi:GDSL-type esterase/lipase family protein [Halobacillus salinarum]|uniref:GDSL-type esterase/lipase family protein n=1 Tax=Halobacillus salinarum TaxID=2932257 RepID=A0ABY4EH91_9BACI|nr:GDSL-type esterase/lipase family protein [Halobacillus salinarum]UOQ42827.1 GDSL-type esterase/lipase family protein [Halobacillus salinarum]